MRGRILALMLALAAVGEARAHRLDAAWRPLPRGMVRVETWFDNGDIPKTGSVEVFDDAGELLVKGRLSSQGLFLFDAPEGHGLRVMIDAGQGHGKELAIRAEELVQGKPAEGTPSTAPTGPAPPPHEPAFPIKDVLIGVALLAAVAALALSLRNARALRELRGRQSSVRQSATTDGSGRQEQG
jgi:hypothetical protein